MLLLLMMMMVVVVVLVMMMTLLHALHYFITQDSMWILHDFVVTVTEISNITVLLGDM